MANTQSAIRRTKRSTIQASVNKIRKNKYKSAIRIMTNHLSKGKVKEAKDFLPKFTSQLMKVAKTGIISREKASRKISRITKKIQNSKKTK